MITEVYVHSPHTYTSDRMGSSDEYEEYVEEVEEIVVSSLRVLTNVL